MKASVVNLLRSYWSIPAAIVGLPTLTYANYIKESGVSFSFITIESIASFGSVVWISLGLAYALQFSLLWYIGSIFVNCEIEAIRRRGDRFVDKHGITNERSLTRYGRELSQSRSRAHKRFVPSPYGGGLVFISLTVFWMVIWQFSFFSLLSVLITIWVLLSFIDGIFYYEGIAQSANVRFSFKSTDRSLTDKELVASGKIRWRKRLRNFCESSTHSIINFYHKAVPSIELSKSYWRAAIAISILTFALKFGSTYSVKILNENLYVFEVEDTIHCAALIIKRSDGAIFVTPESKLTLFVPENKLPLLESTNDCES